ncbi:MAG: hypothetical protein HY287_17990 [Planctomycetes bacterium]|nr:hypothetical protein [Planctomycetota bacterium]MBI3836215.1 hypothetical protein [Planctomycetota bacterium]
MNAALPVRPGFSAWRIIQCLLFVLSTATLGLYTYSCQAPFFWTGSVGPQHWLETNLNDGILDLAFVKLKSSDCMGPMLSRIQVSGESILYEDAGCSSRHSRLQHPVIIFITPDWLYDACDVAHPPAFTLMTRVPLLYASLAFMFAPIAIRSILAARRLLRAIGFRCSECGYPLQGLPALHCPECGQR